MIEIILGINVIASAVICVFLVYSYYRIDRIRVNLEGKIDDVRRTFTRIVEAINNINESEFKWDSRQQKEIDVLNTKITKTTSEI